MRIVNGGIAVSDDDPVKVQVGDAVDCREVNVNGCTFGGDLINNESRGEGAIRFSGDGDKNLISACQIDGAMKLDENAGVKVLNSIGDGVV